MGGGLNFLSSIGTKSATSPPSISVDITERLGVRDPVLPFVNDARSCVTRTIANGRPNRFDRGFIPIQSDME